MHSFDIVEHFLVDIVLVLPISSSFVIGSSHSLGKEKKMTRLFRSTLKRMTSAAGPTLILTATFSILALSNASAALMDSGTSMVDTTTNLEWLDLTQTQGMTLNQVQSSSLILTDGWVYATAAQVTTLFDNAGFLSTNNVNNVGNDPAALLLLGALGCTQFCGTVNATGRGFADNGSPWFTRPNYHTSGLGAGAAIISLQTQNLDLADTTAGHFLIRAIPEPSTALLMGLGLTSLAAARRRQ